jgi:hypothetical protein
MSVSDPRVVQRINSAIQELFQEGDFPGVVDRWLMRFDQATGLVALPHQLDRLMQVTVDDIPLTIVSPWYEYYQYGPGVQDDYDALGNARRCWIDVVKDRGDMPVVTQIPDPVNVPTGPWVLRVYATVNEDVAGVAPEINIQGLDVNGLIIRSLTDGTSGDWYNGLNVPIDFDVPYTQTTQQFSQITGVAKPETNSCVRLTAWNGTDEVELSNYAFNETAPSYRHYYIPKLHNLGIFGGRQKILLARCRKRFVPAADNNDLLIISNLLALSEMVIAQWKRTAGELQEYMVHKQAAVDILRKEATGYLGKSKIPGLTFQRGFPIGSMPFVR